MELKKTDLKNYILKQGIIPGGNQQIIFKFPNGFGASVIRGPFSYGGKKGLLELWKAKFTGGDNWDGVDDPIGHLTKDECLKILYEIKADDSE